MNDLISREAAIDSIYKNHMNGKEGVNQDLENLHGSAVCFSETLQDVVESVEELPTVPAIPIPENATNGDVLKRLLYGKAIITEFIHDVNISVNNNVIGQFDMEWWNALYKRGETNE